MKINILDLNNSVITKKQISRSAILILCKKNKPIFNLDKILNIDKNKHIILFSEINIIRQIKNIDFNGKYGNVALVHNTTLKNEYNLIFAGIDNISAESIESGVSVAIRFAKKSGFQSFVIPLSNKTIKSIDPLSFIIRGAIWGNYNFNKFKTDKNKLNRNSLSLIGYDINKKSVKLGKIQGESLVKIADLANAPGNEATPTKINAWVKSMAIKNKLHFKSMNKKDLIEKKCGGILAVSQGSEQEPKIIFLRNFSQTNKKPIVLIGKTVTFDTGGISLKNGKNMGWMRYDKSGGMTILAIMEIIAKMKLNIPVIGILGIAENMPSGSAIKPGDIIKVYKGKTVEVLNTDAEGRLILADCIGLASDLMPNCIIDIATLTGAVISALGYEASAILGNNQKLINELIKSGMENGEKLWQLPIFEEFSKDMKSDFADLSNLAKTGSAGTSTAAAFLQEFVPKNIPWAHIDIAGTAWKESETLEQNPGATLFSVRLIVNWLSKLKY